MTRLLRDYHNRVILEVSSETRVLYSVNNKSGYSICRARNGKVINANLFKSKRRKKRYSPKG